VIHDRRDREPDDRRVIHDHRDRDARAAAYIREESHDPRRTWGHLQLRDQIGHGSFGEVFAAWDTRLERLVALKLLWHATTDADTAATRDATDRIAAVGTPGGTSRTDATAIHEGLLLARVRHPHVVTVYGADRIDGRVGIWMELIEGRTLDAIVSTHGPLSAPEAILIGLDVCRALAAVHQAGLLHRDLNARNVMREHGGRIVLMDLGAGRPSGARGATTDFIGTLPYLAPEIFDGADASVRSDLYSLGVLLFYLVTGTTPVEGTTAQDVHDRHLAGKRVTLRETRPDLPDEFIAAVERALAATPAGRPASAPALSENLLRASVTSVGIDSPLTMRRGRWWTIAALVISASAVGLAAIGGYAWHARASMAVAQREARVTIALPPLNVDSVAVSPDGRNLAFTGTDASGTSRLWLRPLDAFEARPLTGTDGATAAFWSADSRAIGYFAHGSLAVISASGGAPRIIAEAPNGRGAAWNRAGQIVFAPSSNGPLMRVAAAGGTPVALTMIDHSAGERSHRWPAFTSDGSQVVYISVGYVPSRNGAYAIPIAGGRARRLADIGSNVIPASDLLLFAQGTALLAQRIDPGTLTPLDEPRPLASDLAYYADRRMGVFSWSPAGVLAYCAGEPLVTEFTAYNRAGQPQFARRVSGVVRSFALSPDGTRVLVQRLDPDVGTDDIWSLDLASEMLSRLTLDPANDTDPVWSPDGNDVIFSSNRPTSPGGASSTYHLYHRSAEPGGREEIVSRASGSLFSEDWADDGRVLLVGGEEGSRQIFLLPATDRDHPKLLIAGPPFIVDEPAFSPDGRLFAYHSTESGQPEVFVTSVDNPSLRWQVSRGGVQPRWRADGGELYYLSVDGELMRVEVVSRSPWRAGSPRQLVHALVTRTMDPAYGVAPTLIMNDYAARRDGEQFLVKRQIGGTSRLNVLLNWHP